MDELHIYSSIQQLPFLLLVLSYAHFEGNLKGSKFLLTVMGWGGWLAGNWRAGLSRTSRYWRRAWAGISVWRKGATCWRRYRTLDWGIVSWVWEETTGVWRKACRVCARAWTWAWGMCWFARLARLRTWGLIRWSRVSELRADAALCLGRMVALALRKASSSGERTGPKEGTTGGWAIGSGWATGWVFCAKGVQEMGWS